MTSTSVFRPLLRTALLAGLVGCAGGALAHDWGGHRGYGGGEFAVLHSLSLTDAQQAAVKTAMQSGRAATAPYRTQLRSIQAQIQTALNASGTVTMADVAPLLQQKEQVMAELDQAHMATVLQIRSILTPAQFSQAASMQAKLAALHAQERAVTAEPGTSGQ